MAALLKHRMVDVEVVVDVLEIAHTRQLVCDRKRPARHGCRKGLAAHILLEETPYPSIKRILHIRKELPKGGRLRIWLGWREGETFGNLRRNRRV